MRQIGTRRLFDYWNRLRAGRSAPLRAEIAPDAIGPLLPDVFILDADRLPAHFRLAGTRLCALFDREVTGAPLQILFRHDDRAMADRLVETVSREHVVAIADAHGRVDALKGIDLEIAFLPLADEAARILGAVVPRHTPYWLGTFPLEPMRLTDVRILDVERDLLYLNNRPAIAMPYAMAPSGTKQRQTLRVIEGMSPTAKGVQQAGTTQRSFRIIDGGRTNKG